MAERIKRPEDLLETLLRTDWSKMSYEVQKLRAVRAWALNQTGIDFTAGDRVEIADTFAEGDQLKGSGWYCYRETLSRGATGLVTEIDFSPFDDTDNGGSRRPGWYAAVRFDFEWSVGVGRSAGEVLRWWHGPADQTPAGYEPPGDFDQREHPVARRHTFMLDVEHLRKSPSGEARFVGPTFSGLRNPS